MLPSSLFLPAAAEWAPADPLKEKSLQRWLTNWFADLPSVDMLPDLLGAAPHHLFALSSHFVRGEHPPPPFMWLCTHSTQKRFTKRISRIKMNGSVKRSGVHWICVIIGQLVCRNRCYWLNINVVDINTLQTALCCLSWLSICLKDAWDEMI